MIWLFNKALAPVLVFAVRLHQLRHGSRIVGNGTSHPLASPVQAHQPLFSSYSTAFAVPGCCSLRVFSAFLAGKRRCGDIARRTFLLNTTSSDRMCLPPMQTFGGGSDHQPALLVCKYRQCRDLLGCLPSWKLCRTWQRSSAAGIRWLESKLLGRTMSEPHSDSAYSVISHLVISAAAFLAVFASSKAGRRKRPVQPSRSSGHRAVQLVHDGVLVLARCRFFSVAFTLGLERLGVVSLPPDMPVGARKCRYVEFPRTARTPSYRPFPCSKLFLRRPLCLVVLLAEYLQPPPSKSWCVGRQR